MSEDSICDAAAREAVPPNRFNLTGVDHVGLPSRDPDLSGKFVERILGGIEADRYGYSPEDRALGRLRHIFYHVGAQLVEVVEVDDGVSYPKLDSMNTNPHWAFGTTAEGVAAFAKHLERNGIPFNGPRSHRGATVVSVYFRDPCGNNMEVCTWRPIPPDLIAVTPMRGIHGPIPWAKLAHDWRPAD